MAGRKRDRAPKGGTAWSVASLRMGPDVPAAAPRPGVRAALLRAPAGRFRFMGHNVGLRLHVVTTKRSSLCAPRPRAGGSRFMGHNVGLSLHVTTKPSSLCAYRVLFDGSGPSHLVVVNRARFSEDEPARCFETRVPTLVSKQ